jgi:hypothetical protein
MMAPLHVNTVDLRHLEVKMVYCITIVKDLKDSLD